MSIIRISRTWRSPSFVVMLLGTLLVVYLINGEWTLLMMVLVVVHLHSIRMRVFRDILS